MPPFPLKDQIPPELKPYLLTYRWDINKLHALKLPIETVPINDLLWYLDLPWWQHNGRAFTITPRHVQQEPHKYPEQYQRTMNANLQFPLTVRKGNSRIIIMDGIHRLLKAAIAGNQYIKVKVFDESLRTDIS